ncbi:hypothetical protein [Streptomyces siamensis]|uniref:hypothetical protein n=1 Tax=Streptomyces siamensis TaxID=1274986 RepID=UPI0031F03D99
MLLFVADGVVARLVGCAALVAGIAVALAAALMRGAGSDAAHATQQRRSYLRYLTDTRRQLFRTAALQREADLWSNPEPSELRRVVARRTQLWERRGEDGDFVHVRIGTGRQRLATRLTAPAVPAGADAVCADGVSALVQEYGTLEELPIRVSLRAFQHIHLRGTDEHGVRDLVRSMLAQLVTFHGPDDCRVIVYAPVERSDAWEWIDCLPHARPLSDPAPAARGTALADDAMSLARLLEGLRDRAPFSRDGISPCPHVVVVCDTLPVPTGADWLLDDGRAGVTLIRLVPDTQPGASPDLEITVADDRMTAGTRRAEYIGRPDALTTRQATRLARDLSRLHLGEDEGRDGEDGTTGRGDRA